MSVIPEKILQQVLIKGFSSFRKDNRLIDVLFHNLTIGERDLIKDRLRWRLGDFFDFRKFHSFLDLFLR